MEHDERFNRLYAETRNAMLRFLMLRTNADPETEDLFQEIYRQFYLRNAQGDIVKLIDGTGATVVEYTYDTWGKKVTTTGSLAGTLGLFQPFRYRGYVYDWELGFYYLQSRYYDPAVGRFISADVLLSTGQGVMGHNCYAYCLGNPVRFKDDDGCIPSYSVNMTDGRNTCKFSTLDEALNYFAKTSERWKDSGIIFYANIYYSLSMVKEEYQSLTSEELIELFRDKSHSEIINSYYSLTFSIKIGATIDRYRGLVYGSIEVDGNAYAFVTRETGVMTRNMTKFFGQAITAVYMVTIDDNIITIKEGWIE